MFLSSKLRAANTHGTWRRIQLLLLFTRTGAPCAAAFVFFFPLLINAQQNHVPVQRKHQAAEEKKETGNATSHSRRRLYDKALYPLPGAAASVGGAAGSWGNFRMSVQL